MSIRERVQEEIKTAMKNKDNLRLECLRMVKAALLLKEKDGSGALTDEAAVAAVRGEIKKRQQAIEVFQQVGKADEAARAEQEIAIIREFLPQQLSADEIEARVRAYAAAHPEVDHPGKLTGAMKKALGDAADGKLLNEICRKVLGA